MLATHKIPFGAEVYLPVVFEGHRLSASFRADFVCFEQVIVEIKALATVAGPQHAQVLNYLKGERSRAGAPDQFRRSAVGVEKICVDPGKTYRIASLLSLGLILVAHGVIRSICGPIRVIARIDHRCAAGPSTESVDPSVESLVSILNLLRRHQSSLWTRPCNRSARSLLPRGTISFVCGPISTVRRMDLISRLIPRAWANQNQAQFLESAWSQLRRIPPSVRS